MLLFVGGTGGGVDPQVPRGRLGDRGVRVGQPAAAQRVAAAEVGGPRGSFHTHADCAVHFAQML